MSYSNILSNGGMDPRSKIEDSMYRLTVAQRDAARREAGCWHERYETLLKTFAKNASMHANPPVPLMAEPESFNAGFNSGKAAAERQMMQLFTDPENQPTQHGTVTVEYMQREIAAEREACARLAERSISGLQCAFAIRARGQA